MPTTSTYDINATMKMAGRFTTPPVALNPCTRHPALVPTSLPSHQRYGADVRDTGRLRPKSLSKATKYDDHPAPTVDAPIAYSSTRSHPMIQATNSPMVAYEYVYALPATGTADAISA